MHLRQEAEPLSNIEWAVDLMVLLMRLKGKQSFQLNVVVPVPHSSTFPPSFVSATGRRSVKVTIKRVDGKGRKGTKGR